MSKEFKASEPLGTRTISSYSSASSDSTAPLSPDHPLTRVSTTFTPTRALFYRRTARMTIHAQPAISSGHSARVAEAMTLSDSAFCKRSEEGLGLKGRKEETVPEGQQQAVPAMDTIVGELLALGYKTWRRRELVVGEDQPLPSLEWSIGSLLVLPSSPVVLSPIASLVATPTATISIDEDQFLEVGAQLELYGSILHDQTQCMDALPPNLFEGYDRDSRELYTRLVAVRDEIFSQRYRFRILEREHDRTMMTFSAIWRQRENHDLRRHITEERLEKLELTDRIARMERRQEARGK
nr:hypothetical protein [Tanacetum cinerariifolium]